MKRIVLIFGFVLCVLSLSAVADTKQSGSITLSNSVVVSGTQLNPGAYVVRWDGTGPEVQVQFLHDGKELVSLPGKLVKQRNQYNSSVTTSVTEDGSRTISEIGFSKVTLQFTPKTERVAE